MGKDLFAAGTVATLSERRGPLISGQTTSVAERRSSPSTQEIEKMNATAQFEAFEPTESVAAPREVVETDVQRVAVKRLKYEMERRDWSSSKVAKEIILLGYWMDRRVPYKIIHNNR